MNGNRRPSEYNSMSNSGQLTIYKRCIALQWTLHNIHCQATRRRWYKVARFWSRQTLPTEGDSQQLNPRQEKSTVELGEQKLNNNEQIASKTLLTNFKIPIIWEIRDTMLCTKWASKLSLLSNRTPRISKFEQDLIETPDKSSYRVEGQQFYTYSQLRLWFCWSSAAWTNDCTTREFQQNHYSVRQRQQVSRLTNKSQDGGVICVDKLSVFQ